MRFHPGARFGSYEIGGLLGAGGMGEVYRARDTRLGRDVALKVLPEALVADAERRARLQREARTLAALSHPAVAAIFGLEEDSATSVLVLELVEGETLAERIARGRVPQDEALALAAQIAAGLEAAHEQGIVHRDLKPANIKIRPDGAVKILDFGLAKAIVRDSTGQSGTALANSPTLTGPVGMTGMGVILGTAAYMAPEQARGRMVDKRADIWAFGCVLFEMLAGKPPFAGEDVSSVMAAVMKDEPAWAALPPDVSPIVRRVLRLCLEKDPALRIRDIGDVRLALAGAFQAREVEGGREAGARSRWRAVGLGLAAIALCALATAALLTLRDSAAVPVAQPVTRFSIHPPDGTSWSIAPLAPFPSLSPDGTLLAFIVASAGQPNRIWIRPLDSDGPRPLRGTDNAFGGAAPFWSPDSKTLAFFADGKLKAVDVDGGSVRVIADAPAAEGGAWSANDVILFAPTGRSGLFRVPAAGGRPAPVTSLDAKAGDTSHRHPDFLPDGNRFVYFASGSGTIYLGSLDGSPSKPLFKAISRAIYAAPGYLLFVDESNLKAIRFDADGAATIGEPQTIARGVRLNPIEGRAAVTASDTGVLAFRFQDPPQMRQVQVFDRGGRLLKTLGAPGNYLGLDLSPDQQRLLLSGGGFDADVFVMPIDGRAAAPVTFDRRFEQAAIWTARGDGVTFAAQRGGTGGSDVYEMNASGVGGERLLAATNEPDRPQDWSPDGNTLLLLTGESGSMVGRDLWFVRRGSREPEPFLQTDFDVGPARFSPDGRWIAYGSRETGAYHVYVQPFPPNGSKVRVSGEGGGGMPHWTRAGRELIYLAEDGTVLAVDVDGRSSAFEVRAARRLFSMSDAEFSAGAGSFSPFEVDANGETFYVLGRVGEARSSPITVVLNWFNALTPPLP